MIEVNIIMTVQLGINKISNFGVADNKTISLNGLCQRFFS
jgi:hypothetical protein